ncbi:hypothetical protein CH253_18270 [Rhodococcus sp. 06-156-3C]|nr:hypothetical protein CH248_27470 [Rhodococcus sp. 06-156-4a]OZD17882.1 hypothetical protein CH253_18270 [Rhodococcus sp. 06-156-3C]OZD20607.1 hypothetical protein CH280_03425 [Rhodococcus sp. 06-156-4C]OZD30674.1 hypothetical protein CH247_15300 [Rhodococcus sp. 06-156-3b]OZD32552.1 hypothetical protein CH284_19955 [Rhodococcus sp. 06-156-3]OZF65036.1 hypothetical protein CH290_10625 [Rhodococcus sp. 06-156-4]
MYIPPGYITCTSGITSRGCCTAGLRSTGHRVHPPGLRPFDRRPLDGKCTGTANGGYEVV